MDFDEVWSKYQEILYSEMEVEPSGASNAPLLAHYTSLVNLENILRHEQVWLSNPLFMNDLEEVRFGINNGVDLVYKSTKLRKALGTDERANLFFDEISKSFDEYGREHVLDLYVMCFSLHEKDNYDGRLSMWRGYGSDGRGAAIVFDVSHLEDSDDTPLVLAPVVYASQATRRATLKKKIGEVGTFFVNNEIPNNYLAAAAHALFDRIALYAIFSKHSGFDEEQEWRLVYFKDRDPRGVLSDSLGYLNGPEGLQPKLKLAVKPILGALSEGVVLDEIIERIIIGPTASSPLAEMTAKRMLTSLGKEDLIPRLKMSSIPYRGD